MQQFSEPHARFEAVKEFITETTRLTQEQLFYLDLFRPILDARHKDAYKEEQTKIQAAIAENVDCISTASQTIKAQTRSRVFVQDAATGTALPAHSIGYDFEKRTYFAIASDNSRRQVFDGSQLSLQTSTGTRELNPLVYAHDNALSLRGIAGFRQDDGRQLPL